MLKMVSFIFIKFSIKFDLVQFRNFYSKQFLFLCVMTIASEIGGIISLSILRTKLTDIVEEGWNEMNQKTRNIIQTEVKKFIHYHFLKY